MTLFLKKVQSQYHSSSQGILDNRCYWKNAVYLLILPYHTESGIFHWLQQGASKGFSSSATNPFVAVLRVLLCVCPTPSMLVYCL